MVIRALTAEGCSARGRWALVILNQCSEFTGSGLWNAKTRGSCFIGQGRIVQEDDPPSVKTQVLGGGTRKSCWEVQDEGAGERLRNFGSEYAFWNRGANAVPVMSKDNIYCGMRGLCCYFQEQLSLFKKTYHGVRKQTRDNVFLHCVRKQGVMWMPPSA